MATRIIVLSTGDNGNREDCNIFYSGYIIVKSDTLKFDEPLFLDDNFQSQLVPDSYETAVEALRFLGYEVEEPEIGYIECESQ